MQRAFERQAGVTDFEFDINTGLGFLTPPLDRKLDLAILSSAVNDAGFKLEWMQLEVSGQVGSTPNLSVSLPVRGQHIRLLPGSSDVTRKNLAELMARVGAQQVRVRVQGRASSLGGGQAAMEVEEFQILD